MHRDCEQTLDFLKTKEGEREFGYISEWFKVRKSKIVVGVQV